MARGAAQECNFGGAAGAAAQLTLFVLALASLAYKRQRETPRRNATVWAFDVSKQGMSSLAAHASGMVWSHVLSGPDASECAYYLVIFTIDTTVGVAISLALHRRMLAAARGAAVTHPAAAFAGPLLERLAPQRAPPWPLALARNGEYGEPPSWRVWAVQMSGWCACVIIGACAPSLLAPLLRTSCTARPHTRACVGAARTVCGLLVLLLRPLLGGVPRLVDAAFAGAPGAELAVTMVLFPLALNTAQAWVQDTHLKAAAAGHGARHGRSGSRGAAPGGLEAVREEPTRERISDDGGAANAELGKAAAEQGAGPRPGPGGADGDDREALLSPYRGDS